MWWPASRISPARRWAIPSPTSVPEVDPLPGFQTVKPQVYAGIFTFPSDDYEDFREALAKLALNDASLFFEPETSDALGFGFRCGFLGMLHMEIMQERLEREYDLEPDHHRAHGGL